MDDSENKMDAPPVPEPLSAPDLPDYSEPLPRQNIPEEPLIHHKVHGLKRGDVIFLSLLFLAAFFSVMLTDSGGFGLSWDEAYYYQPSRDAAGWLIQTMFGPDRPLSADEIESAWGEIRELPSMPKLALGLSSLMFSDWLGPLRAMRIPSAVAYALSLVLIYLLALKVTGRPGALAAVFSYALLPRIFGHAHIAAAESITVFMTLLTVYCFLKGLKNPWWSVFLGIVFGLALNTKINCIFLPAILIPWAHAYHRRKYVNNFFAMAFLSPVIMVITWPWLWHNSAARLLEYIYFFVTHQKTAIYYFGEKYNYGSETAPWHYPFVMTFLTTLPVVILFTVFGIISSLKDVKSDSIKTLFLWSFFAFLAISALPASPRYDGVRLFLPAFPFLALLSGIGLHAILLRLPKGPPFRGAVYMRDLAAAVGILLIITGGLFSIIRIHPHELSYYNVYTGGLPGAWKKGMETTYWGEAVNEEVIKVLNELPPDAEIKTLALHDKVFDLLQKWDRLRSDLEINEGDPPWDYHLLLVRKSFFSRPEWTLFANWPRMKVFEEQGVPLVILSRTGSDFEKTWPRFDPAMLGK